MKGSVCRLGEMLPSITNSGDGTKTACRRKKSSKSLSWHDIEAGLRTHVVTPSPYWGASYGLRASDAARLFHKARRSITQGLWAIYENTK